MPKGTILSQEVVKTRSASGHIEQEPVTAPTMFTDKVSGENTIAQVIVSSTCPVHFMGRDLMAALGIGMVPRKKWVKIN